MLAPIVAAVLPEVGLGLPRDAAMGGERIDSLLHQTAALTGAVALTFTLLLLISILRRHRSLAAPSPRLTAYTALVLFAIIDGNLLLRGGLAEAQVGGAPLQVEVNAHQWAWDIREPGPDGQFGTPDDIVQLNELVIPVGRTVEVELAAVDVVHGFSIPALRIKADAVPGMITHLSFAAATEGEYEIACAQHCGLNHYKMRGVLEVVSAAAYQDWLAAEGREAIAGNDPADVGAHWAWRWVAP